jgi:hypothetical protein
MSTWIPTSARICRGRVERLIFHLGVIWKSRGTARMSTREQSHRTDATDQEKKQRFRHPCRIRHHGVPICTDPRAEQPGNDRIGGRLDDEDRLLFIADV